MCRREHSLENVLTLNLQHIERTPLATTQAARSTIASDLEHVHDTKYQNMKIHFIWSGSAVTESRSCAGRRSKMRYRVAIAFHNTPLRL